MHVFTPNSLAQYPRTAQSNRRRTPLIKWLALLPLSLLILLNGCALQKLPDNREPDRNWEQHRQALAAIDSWELRGRIALRTAKDSGSATLLWLQQADHYTIRIIGPLGRGSVELQGSPAGVSLQEAKGASISAGDPETLLFDYLGWYVPLSGLKYWIRGLPDPQLKIDNLVLDEQARLLELAQGGWQLHFLRYHALDNIDLPQKLEMENRDLQIKLLIKDWELQP